jgi:hypothetical protein
MKMVQKLIIDERPPLLTPVSEECTEQARRSQQLQKDAGRPKEDYRGKRKIKLLYIYNNFI